MSIPDRLDAAHRIVVVLMRVSDVSLAYARLSDAAVKVSRLRALDRSCPVLSLRVVLRVLHVSQSQNHTWKREDECGLDDLPSMETII